MSSYSMKLSNDEWISLVLSFQKKNEISNCEKIWHFAWHEASRHNNGSKYSIFTSKINSEVTEWKTEIFLVEGRLTEKYTHTHTHT